MMDNEDRHRAGKVTVDGGGETRFGIAHKYHPEVPESFYTANAHDALVRAADFYREGYWAPIRGVEILDQRVASKCFDVFVNLPPVVAVKLIQGAAMELGQKIGCDGHMGPLTVCAINQIDPEKFLETVCAIQAKHYREHGDQKVIEGLLNRASAVPKASV
jgi:lysozyme family protein